MADKKENTQNFAELYDRNVRQIFNFIYYKTFHKETAEDLTSETFVKALKKISTFDKEKGKFSTWLYQIARNTVVDFYRTKKNYLNIDDAWDLADEKDILQDFDTAEKIKEVKSHLAKLSKDQREIVILRIWQEMPYKEIAEIIDKDEADCRMSFSRAIKKLKSQLPLSLFLALLLF